MSVITVSFLNVYKLLSCPCCILPKRHDTVRALHKGLFCGLLLVRPLWRDVLHGEERRTNGGQFCWVSAKVRMQGSLEKFRNNHYTGFLWLFCCCPLRWWSSSVPETSLGNFFQRHETAVGGPVHWHWSANGNELFMLFVSLEKVTEKSGGEENGKKKSHCVQLLVLWTLLRC